MNKFVTREEDLSPTVVHRHTEILKINRWLDEVNKMLKKLYKMQSETKSQSRRSPGVRFHNGNDAVYFDFNNLYNDKNSYQMESYEVMCDLNKSMVSGYITFLEAERESLIRKFNEMETATLPQDGKEVPEGE